MRYLRLLPLLVLLCPAPAAADDHRVDMNVRGEFCAAGAISSADRLAVGVPGGTSRTRPGGTPSNHSVSSVDVAIESGTDDGGYEKRETYALGGAGTPSR